MLPDYDKEMILDLISACNELINGKFILADNKISNILKCIAESKVLYELFTECMLDFNKTRELNRAMIKMPSKPGYFVMPEDKTKILPLVFCVLVEIEDRELDFRNFLKTYFQKQDTDEFKNFANEVIRPFKDIIADIFELSNEYIKPKKEVKEEEVEEENNDTIFEEEKELDDINENEKLDDDVFSEILRISEEMLTTLSYEKKRNEIIEDAEFVLSAIVNACQFKNFYQINALIVGLNYISSKIKSLRFLNKELKEVVEDYYLNQQN